MEVADAKNWEFNMLFEVVLFRDERSLR